MRHYCCSLLPASRMTCNTPRRSWSCGWPKADEVREEPTTIPRSRGSVCRRPRVPLAFEVRPGVGDTAVQTVRLLLHHRRQLSVTRARLMAVAQLVAHLVIDGVRPVGRDRGAVSRDGVLPPVLIDDHLTG